MLLALHSTLIKHLQGRSEYLSAPFRAKHSVELSEFATEYVPLYSTY